MKQTHSLLKRQLKRYLGGQNFMPKEWQDFIEAVNNAYCQSDNDRNMLERSLELSSQELLQANSELRAIFQAFPDLFFRLDNEGTILDCKGGITTDLYIPLENLLGKRFHGVPFEELGNKLLEAIHQARETKSIVSIEYSMRIQEQENFYEARLLPLLEDQIIAIIRNITERKRMQGELLRVQKLESISILAGGIAHDFNNILTAILGNISLAKMYANPEDKICEKLTEAEKASVRAKDLTQQLLTFSKGGQPIVKTAHVTRLLKDTTSFALTGSNVRCEFFMSEDLWPVEMDEGQMSQVINNLVINAVKSMPKGGTIKVWAENATVGTERTKQSLPLEGENYVKISIQDQGIGIPKEHLRKIFDPYFTTRKKGSGLGLAISYSIVQKHHGYITAESELGVGTTFHIFLPASEKEVITETHAKEIVRGEKGRVLIMDDEEIVRDVASGMLEHIGYEVEVAKDGAEAIALYEQAQESQVPFDVVILDLTVPGGMGGKETIEKLIELDPQAKAIVSSGYSTDPVMSDFREYGFSSVVSKPYKIEELREALHKARWTLGASEQPTGLQSRW
ncbi:MAG: response regulator [Deltaproteobacteria bacterium]|nr:response regulator [Deltaproteobacteria bacterium]MBW2331095.1 response regulator [Deltaproteobacteria bacterium]